MEVGLGVLRLPPAAFWAMTPRELAAAIAGLGGARPLALGRAEFTALAARFPDRPKSKG